MELGLTRAPNYCTVKKYAALLGIPPSLACYPIKASMCPHEVKGGPPVPLVCLNLACLRQAERKETTLLSSKGSYRLCCAELSL